MNKELVKTEAQQTQHDPRAAPLECPESPPKTANRLYLLPDQARLLPFK